MDAEQTQTGPEPGTAPRPDPAAVGEAVRQVLGDSLAYLHSAALRAAVQAGVADHLADGPLSAEQLAKLGGVRPDQLKRVLRLLATRGVFREDEDGAFHLTTAAGLLRSDSPLPLRSLVLLFTDEMYWLPAGRLDQAVARGTTMFDEVFGVQIFDLLAGDEQRARLFSDAMACLSLTEHGQVAAAADAFPEQGVVVDVGGGLGGQLGAVLGARPGLRGILFDREPVLRRTLLAADPALAGRWEAVAGDFYERVPAGADVYLLKRILHDKSDSDCVRVLKACRHAMGEHGRVLIVDPLVPSTGDYPVSVKLSDVLMLAVFEGRERTSEQLAELLAAAGLSLSRILPTAGALVIVEAVAA